MAAAPHRPAGKSDHISVHPEPIPHTNLESIVSLTPNHSGIAQFAPKSFKPIGRAVPWLGPRTVQEVDENAQYVRSELKRWIRSIAFLCDDVEPEEEGELQSFLFLLDCLSRQVTTQTCERLAEALKNVLPPIAQFAGAVITSKEENSDLTAAVRTSLLSLATQILEVDAKEKKGAQQSGAKGLSDTEKGKIWEIKERAEKYIEMHKDVTNLRRKALGLPDSRMLENAELKKADSIPGRWKRFSVNLRKKVNKEKI